MDGTVSRGLTLAVRLLAVDDHDTLVAKMQRCLTRIYRSTDETMEDTLGFLGQFARREQSRNARDEAEQRRDPMNFAGDTVPPNAPPLAWVLLWNKTYANIYGEYVPRILRHCGYVMWDEHRWTELGAEGLVAMQWETAPELVEKIETFYNWRPTM